MVYYVLYSSTRQVQPLIVIDVVIGNSGMMFLARSLNAVFRVRNWLKSRHCGGLVHMMWISSGAKNSAMEMKGSIWFQVYIMQVLRRKRPRKQRSLDSCVNK
jgi:hypothetical protein